MSITRIERLGMAYPDHIERIKECITAHYGHNPMWLNHMLHSACTSHEINNPSYLLCEAFPWDKTTEGMEFWRTLPLNGR